MITKKEFGTTKKGNAFLYTLNNDQIEAAFTDYGATVVSLVTQNKDGVKTDILLGYDSATKYEKNDKYLGATVGRCSNRIKGGIIHLNNSCIQVSQNEGENQLHGGVEGFNKKLWNISSYGDDFVCFSYLSQAGEEGYPANLLVNVKYKLEKNSLIIDYEAKSDADTICALTNHSYFNLNGYSSGDILQHQVQIFADYFTPNDSEALPTGEILSVKDTPMDFTSPKLIGLDIESNYKQIKYASGFDNNWIINRENCEESEIVKAAQAYSEKSGIKLEVFTNLLGIQFYSGNFLDGSDDGKENSPIKNRCAFCLECQYFPNAFANKNFPQPVLRSGEVYRKTIVYKVSAC